MTSQMTIGKKLILSFGAALALTLMVSALALEGFSSLGADMNRVINVNARKLFLATDINATQSDMLAAERGILARAFMKDKATNQSLDQSVVAMGEINTQSDKIARIIKVIDEIAFQTNILALNAAVEAARAGEAGMGFAVVADEVRNLAQRCAQAARDTSALIEESIAKSNDGKTKVDQVATAIRAITEDGGKVKTLVDEVNLGSQEQVRGIEQIAKAIAQMDRVTQKTAADAEETASAAEELNAQSETLKDIVDRLTAMVGGGASNGPRRPTRQPATASRAKAPQRRTESRASLAALPPKSVEHEANKDPFPMEEDFKEF